VSSGLLALLMWLETKQAKVQAAEARGGGAAKQAADAAALATQLQQVSDAATDLVETAEHNLQSGIDAAAQAAANAAAAVALEAGRTDHVFAADYSLTAKNLSLTSRSNLPGRTSLTVAAEGGGLGTNGFLYLRGSKQALLQSGPAYVKTSTAGATGKVNIGNALAGTITLQQGIPNLGPAIVMDGIGQSIKLSVGPPGVGASIELSAAGGITLKFALWSLTINAMGISAKVGENNLTINPASVTIKGLNVQTEAALAMAVKGTAQQESEAAAITQVKGALVQIN
jgi:hypothetical protein